MWTESWVEVFLFNFSKTFKADWSINTKRIALCTFFFSSEMHLYGLKVSCSYLQQCKVEEAEVQSLGLGARKAYIQHLPSLSILTLLICDRSGLKCQLCYWKRITRVMILGGSIFSMYFHFCAATWLRATKSATSFSGFSFFAYSTFWLSLKLSCWAETD